MLLYAHDRSDPEKQERARAVLDGLWANRTGVVSTQVLQEFYAVATRKWTPPLGRSEAREVVALYATWQCIQIDPPLILDASELEERHQFAFWDAVVVEASRRAGATVLLTEDLSHGQLIGGVRIEDPFA